MSNHDYRKGAHTVYRLHYHFVFVPKYRKPVLVDAVGRRVRDLVRQICQTNDIEIVKGHVRPDHVHLLLSIPPKLAPSRVMQLIKGRQLRGALRGTGLQAHHLIERRFAARLFGISRAEGLSAAVTPAEHQVFTNAWRTRIPYGPSGTAVATRESVLEAARNIYRNYPEILRALGL